MVGIEPLVYGTRITCTLSGQMCNPSGDCDFAEAGRFFWNKWSHGGGKVWVVKSQQFCGVYRLEHAIQSELASAGYWKG